MNVIVNSVQAFEAELAARPASSSYHGRQGCACGCRGSHSDRKATITRRINRMRELIASGEAEQISVVPGVFVAVDTATTMTVAYTDGRGA